MPTIMNCRIMNIIKYPAKSEWKAIVERPHMDLSKLNETVSSVLKDIKDNGDEAVKRYEEKFDHVQLSSLAVTPEELEEAMHLISPELKASLEQAHHNIAVFHEAQKFEGKKILQRCDLLAEEHSHREGRTLYPRWHRSPLLYRSDARYPRENCRMSGDCSLYAPEQRGEGQPRHPCRC